MLTIVIPSYNHVEYIYECLIAASSVQVEGRELLIIDDGSTDGTCAVVQGFINENPEIKVDFIQKQNSGLVSSLNLALEHVNTEYVYICASDDIPIASGVESCTKYLSENRNVNFCVGGAVNFNGKDGGESLAYGEAHNRFFAADFSNDKKCLFLNYPSPLLLQSTVFRKTALLEVGGWDKDLKLDDYPMFVKLLQMNTLPGLKKFVFLPDLLVVRYRHHGNNTYANLGNQYFMIKQALEKLAPADMLDEALSHKAAYYILVALKRVDIVAVFKILSQCSFSTKVKLPYHLVSIGASWFFRISQ